MYCQRCNINTEYKFCENCGGETVSTKEAPKQEEHKEEFNREDFKMNLPKFSKKKIISLVTGALLLVVGIGGYSSIQSKNTPKSTVEKYFNYLADGNYSSAYKMLEGTDDKFLSEYLFKKSMEQTDFKDFKIEEFTPEQYKMVYYDPNNSTNFDITNSSNVFSVNIGLKFYPINVLKDGKKLLFFDDYKIDVKGFTTKWLVTAPKGAKVDIEVIEPNKSSQPVGNIVTFNDNYNPMLEGYELSIFSGNFNINSEMEGGEKVSLTDVQAGSKTDIKFEPSKELITELEGNTKKFLELYYSNSTEDKYSDIVLKGSGVLEKINQLNTFSSSKITNQLTTVEITEKKLEDMEHATITVKGTVQYEDSSLVEFGMNKLSGTKDLLTEIRFKKDNGKWLIVETGYLN